MADIKAFRGLRFTESAGNIKDNVCPPYDIISDSEREALINKSENNIIRLELPRGEEPYKTAGATLKRWLDEGVLKCEDKESLYIYEEDFEALGKTYKIKGLVCLVKLEEFSAGVVLPHEETLSKAKTDRFNLMSETFCNFSQIYSMYVDEKSEIPERLDRMSEKKADVEFINDDGITQKLWICQDSDDITYITDKFKSKQLYIADGHHRYETALNFKKKLIEDGKITIETDLGNYVMMFLIDIDNPGLVIFPTHRLVKDLENYDEEKAVEGIKEFFDVEKRHDLEKLNDVLNATDKRSYAYYTGQDYYYLCTIKDEDSVAKLMPEKSEAYSSLDVTALHTLILERVFGIDKDNMARQINLTYTRDYKEAIDGVRSNKYQCSFIIKSTKIHQIKDVAAAGEKMPQKSTYFYPKLITGLVMNKIL